MSAEERVDPYLNYRFVVEIEGITLGGFSGVSGLSLELKTEEVSEGGVNTHTHKLPTSFGYQNLVLKRGLTDRDGLWTWIAAAVNGPVSRQTVQVYLLDDQGERVWGWSFLEAYPVKWTGPEFQADQAAVALETLELSHNGVRTVEGLPQT